MDALLKGLVIGFAIAAPVGPIGVLCIRRSLAQSAVMGFATGLGAATADGLYGAVAAFCLTAISATLLEQKLWLSAVGGAFLVYLGVKTFMAKPADAAAQGSAASVAAAYASTVFLTLANPATILSFVAVFAGLGLGRLGQDFVAATIMVLGVFLGSALWWLILSATAGGLRTRLASNWMVWVNRCSGAIVLGFGIWAVAVALAP